MTPQYILAYHGTDAFEDFERFEFSSDIGFHFGTIETANARLAQTTTAQDLDERALDECGPRVIPVVIEAVRIERVADCHTWLNGEARAQLLAAGVLTQDQFEAFEADGWIPGPDELAPLAEAQGIHALVYENQTEGGGDSFIVFNPARVHFALRRPDLVRQALRAPLFAR